MKQIIKKLFIVLLTTVTVITITACGKDKKKKTKDYVVSPNINYKDEMDDDLFEDSELHEVDIPNPDAFSNAYMDVEPNFTLQLMSKGVYLSTGQVKDAVYLRDEYDQRQELLVEELVTGDFCGYSLSSKEGYKSGRAYTISIENAPNLLFKDKDESVRKVIFSVKSEDKDICTPRTDYKTYDIKKISYFSGYGDFDTYLLYDGSFDSKVGDVVIFDGAEDEEKIYIKVKKIEKNKELYKIFYEAPTGGELFSELDLHVDHKEVDLEESLVLKTKEEIVNEVKNSGLAEEFIAYAAYAYNFDEQLMMTSKEFWDHVFIDINFNVSGNTFTTKLSISFTFTTENNWRIILFVNFRYSETYVTSGGVTFDTFLGVPYHINMNVSLSSNVNVAVEFRACVANPKFPKTWANLPQDPNQFSQKDAEAAIEEMIQGWKNGTTDFNKREISGDTFMIGLGGIYLRFWGWLCIDFDLYLCITNKLNITLGLGYTYNYTKTLVSYSSDTDAGDGATSPSSVSTQIINGSFVGKYYAEFYFKLRLSIYVKCFKWLLYLYVDADAGLYFDIRGIASFTWDLSRGELTGDGGFYIEYGLMARLTFGVNILNTVNPTYTLFDGKYPLLLLNLTTCITGEANEQTVNINQKVTNVQGTTMLCYKVFDYNSLATTLKVLKPTEEVVWLQSEDKPKKYKIFSNFKSDNPKIQIVGDNLVVSDDAGASEEATITFTYDAGLKKHEDSVKIKYISNDAKRVTFDGSPLEKEYYLPGESVVFPKTVENRTGYIFKGYKVNGVLVDRMEDYIVGNDNINFESYYIEDITYTINFYDHHLNLIATVEAKNGDVVNEPIFVPEDGYDFVGWDKDYSIATKDMSVYAICVKRGDA